MHDFKNRICWSTKAEISYSSGFVILLNYSISSDLFHNSLLQIVATVSQDMIASSFCVSSLNKRICFNFLPEIILGHLS
ncbi:hypothetical protein HMPREF0379_0040 [[Eubacterium] yurii subsp. margaretiae ATCC 43715]|nr:hypothetical protein HMPREF0379_0040 [[Eubacterium] yurii subsp. margaretiae ATCC 43715]